MVRKDRPMLARELAAELGVGAWEAEQLQRLRRSTLIAVLVRLKPGFEVRASVSVTDLE